MDESPVRGEQLTPEESEGLLLHVAQLANAQLPIGEGLLAASREVRSARLSRALSRLGEAMRQGTSLKIALDRCRDHVPPHLAAALAAAEEAGQLGPVLAEWTENQLATQSRSRQLAQTLAYPTICVILSVTLLTFLGWYLMPAFEQMFREFELPLPDHTVIVLAVSRYAFPVVAAALAAAAVVLLLLRYVAGRAAWCWCRSQLPLLGKVWHWSGVAEALRVLAILLEHRTPLGEALRLAGQGASDAHVGRVLCGLAAQIEAGASFPDSVDEDGRLPRSLVPVLRAGERSGALAQGARDGAIMLEKRVAAQGDLIAAIVPPLLLLFVGMALMSAITALMLPMMSVLRGLSL